MMKRATATKPFITDRNEIVLNGDVIYVEGTKIFYKRLFLGNVNLAHLDNCIKIEKEF